MVCRICGNDNGNREYQVKEMMFGSGEEFPYFQCDACGCLQIGTVPEDLSDYYPNNYFSFSKNIKDKPNIFRNFIYSQRLEYELGTGNMAGRIFSLFARPIGYVPWLKIAGCNQRSKVLDVGCGHGKLLLKMAAAGMRDLTGIDPFIEKTISYSDRLNVYKYDLECCPENWKNSFDLIMLHHSFEHMDEPKRRLLALKSLLSKSGVLLIRIPVADSYAWREYQESWLQIDAPRHFYLHTDKSIKLLCEAVGLEVFSSESVGEIGQFIGSELYRRGIPLNATKKQKDSFSRQQLDHFRQQTKALNLSGEGDQRVFAIRAKR